MISLCECLDKLRSPDERERMFAAEDIGYLNLPEGVPSLTSRLFEESSVAVRDAIFQALVRMDGAAPVEGAIGLLFSEDTQIRNQAVDVLRHKGQQAIPSLSRAMREGGRDVRKLVLDVLSGTSLPGSGEIYSLALSDEDPNVVITAVESLGGIRALEYRDRIEALLESGGHPMLIAACMEALAGLGQACSIEAIRRTFPRLELVPDFLLASYLKAIGSFGEETDFHAIAGLLDVRTAHLRPAIFAALQSIHARWQLPGPGEELLPTLRAVIENGDPPLCRYQAVQLLGCWAVIPGIFDYLAQCLESSERLVRLAAAESLIRVPGAGKEALIAARQLNEIDEEILQALGC